MKRIVLTVFLCLLVFPEISETTPIFGDGTFGRDTVWIDFTTFDTLGFVADCDTYFVRRFYHASLVDSTFGTSSTNRVRTGYYSIPKRAFNGAHYGQYSVEIEWHIERRAFKKCFSYVVVKGGIDSTRVELDGIIHTGATIPTVTSVTNPVGVNGGGVGSCTTVVNNVNINSNSDITAIRNKTDKLTFDGEDSLIVEREGLRSGLSTFDHTLDEVILTSGTHTGAVIPTVTDVTNSVNIISNTDITDIKNQTDRFQFDGSNNVKSTPQTGDWLTLSDLPDMADTFWVKDTAEYKQAFGTMGEHLMHKAGGGATAQQIWEYQGEITLQDTIPKVYAVNIDPDTTASHVWNWLTRTLTTGAGSGANQVSIKVLQSSDSAEIVGAQVQILNLNQTSTLGLLTTNSKGCATFALDNDTLLVRIYKPGWVFTVPETLKVFGDTDTTYHGVQFDPGHPPAPGLCRVYGWIKDIKDLPVSGAKVQAKIDLAPLRYQKILISPYFRETTTDSEGYWYLDLFPNSVLNPDTTSYTILIYGSRGIILNLKAKVPIQSSWELSF